MTSQRLAKDALNEIRETQIVSDVYLQKRLDIVERSRKSYFGWRGQFSPDLIDYLLEHHAIINGILLDPFCGSGTSLFEGSRYNMNVVGSDVNPAAFILAYLAKFSELNESTRVDVLNRISSDVERFSGNPDLFSSNVAESMNIDSFLGNSENRIEYAIRLSILMNAFKDSRDMSPEKIQRGAASSFRALSAIPHSKNEHNVLLEDARFLEVNDSSIDLIITSPPYINVFNYHQNYRPVLEAAGWRPLQCAVSEIGANRKHRMNRFLTVIQYSIDMASVLHAMHRKCRENAKLILVVGRTSNVRGVPFMNGELLSAICSSLSLFDLDVRSERKYTNRFGQTIYEDVLTFRRSDVANNQNREEVARALGVQLLQESLSRNIDTEVRGDIESAIAGKDAVQQSPELSIKAPELFVELQDGTPNSQVKDTVSQNG